MPVIEGDPYGKVKEEKKAAGPDPREVNNFHSRDDVDSSTTAHHHTLGIKHDQASPGDHVHDGRGSRKIGYGMGLSVNVSGATQTDLDNLIAMLSNVVEFQVIP
jgi:hypothetical protein